MTRKFRSLNKHHVIPTSRNGGDIDNIMLLDEDWHNAYHYCFENLTIDEAKLMLDIMFKYRPLKRWEYRDIRCLMYAIRENDDVFLWEIITNLEDSNV